MVQIKVARGNSAKDDPTREKDGERVAESTKERESGDKAKLTVKLENVLNENYMHLNGNPCFRIDVHSFTKL